MFRTLPITCTKNIFILFRVYFYVDFITHPCFIASILFIQIVFVTLLEARFLFSLVVEKIGYFGRPMTSFGVEYLPNPLGQLDFLLLLFFTCYSFSSLIKHYRRCVKIKIKIVLVQIGKLKIKNKTQPFQIEGPLISLQTSIVLIQGVVQI